MNNVFDSYGVQRSPTMGYLARKEGKSDNGLILSTATSRLRLFIRRNDDLSSSLSQPSSF